jgi:hypothetical protein
MACTDVQTIQAGNGSKTQFSFDFPYIFKSEIHVYFWNVTTKEYDEKLTTDGTYPWQVTDANPTIVEFTGTAPPSPAAPTDPGESTVDNVKIRRITKLDDISALFNPGSAIRSDDLNKNFEQLRYAIQEANCAGIPDDVDDYLKQYYWNNFDSTVYSTETWDSDDDQVATTQAIDARVDAKIDTAITSDIGTDGTGITVTNDGDGTITLGLNDDAIDFGKLKDVDIITYAEQNASSPAPADTNIFTASAAARRFDTLVQSGTPAGSDWETGKTWLQNTADLTLSVWNGSAWTGVASGGTFTNQPKVVYVDASSGSDSNDGHRISRPKLTIKAAVQQINADATFGNGSVVVVAPGTYQEACPIDIEKSNVSIVGTALRSCIVHPTVATEENTMFRVNSGTFIQNITFTGMKASGALGNADDASLPVNQGWNIAFLPGCTIVKSPYIQNCTNFSDSEIDNSAINVITPGGGLAGDNDSAPTGGGVLINGATPAVASPLRSIVCDSYTHVGLNGPGLLVTNNGYTQCTSSYAFFNKYHIKALNGGQANLAASTTDFGDQALVADGKSSAAIFTSNVDGTANSGAISFNINQPAAGVGWFGDTQRPASNMLVTVNSVTYPILSAVANTDTEGGNGWTVTISRPNPNNRSVNLGLNGALADDLAVSFFLRSQIASSGHTMEYVGSGTDYRALPENGGVPDDSKQKTELNDGKIWTATTDHNGKFTIGGNQTDDPFFEVDQQLGFVTIPSGSIAFDLKSDLTPQLGGDLDVNSNTITGLPASPSAGTEATSKTYVDAGDATNAGNITTNTTNIATNVTNIAARLPLAGGTMTGDIVFNSGQTIAGYTPRTSATGSSNLSAGTTAQRDGSPAGGMVRYNTSTASFEGYTTGWGSLGSGPLLKTNRLENTTTTDGGIDIDSSGHVKIDGLQMPTAGALSNRNLITNGAMQVSQRGTSLANTADGTYLVDRFRLYDAATNTHTLTQSQSSNVPNFPIGTGFSKSLRVEVTSGAATPTTGYTVISQPIEGFDAAQLNYGTANAKTVTLSFWVRTNVSGNYSVALRNSAADYNYIAQFSHMGADAWFQIKRTIPGATAGTWLIGNGRGLEVMWTLDSGSNWFGTEDAWNTSNVFNLAANDNDFSDTTGNYFELTGVQLEVGSKATPFEHKSYAETLAKCQRYFEGVPAGSTFNQGDAIVWSGYALLNGINYATKAFTVEKRAIPTVAMTNNSVIAGFNAATCQVAVAGTRGIRGNATATGTVGARYFFLHFTADAEL